MVGQAYNRAMRVVAGASFEDRADEGDVGSPPRRCSSDCGWRTVSDDHELRFAVSPADFLERFYAGRESIARVESPEEENTERRCEERRGGERRVEDVGGRFHWGQSSSSLEVSIESDRGRVRDRDSGVQLIESLLEVSVADSVKERAVEIGVERANHRAIGFFDRHHWQYGTERRVDVDDVVLSQAEDPAQVLSQLESA